MNSIKSNERNAMTDETTAACVSLKNNELQSWDLTCSALMLSQLCLSVFVPESKNTRLNKKHLSLFPYVLLANVYCTLN